MKLLLVDDDQELTSLLEIELREQGHEVDTASEGITGVKLALKNSYDVIVLDLMLPGIHGHSICKTLRHNHIETPVLMISALDSVEEIETGFSSGISDYMVKPFSFEALYQKIIALNQEFKRHSDHAGPDTYLKN